MVGEKTLPRAVLYCTDMADTVRRIISTISATCIRDQTLRYGGCFVPSITTSYCSRPFSALSHSDRTGLAKAKNKGKREIFRSA